MNEKDRIKLILKTLNMPSGRWVLAGSGALIMQGALDRSPRDIDIFCATQTWFSIYKQTEVRSLPDFGRGAPSMTERVPLWELFATDPDDSMRRCDPPYLYRTIEGIEVNVFSNWRRRGIGDIDVAFWIHNAVMVDDIPCTSVQFMLDWKKEVGRAKDVEDIEMLEKFLEAKNA